MTKLLVIADDYTGALDTGVQFAGKGIKTQVLNRFPPEHAEMLQAEVWVIDAETRHLDQRQAYQKVFQIVSAALEYKIPYIYKKTDSGLRGNVGSELEAALEAGKEQYLTFIPALPGMDRITKNGVHYIEGVPLRESAFGRDPFDPVASSYVPDLFSRVAAKIAWYPRQDHYQRGADKEIGIFDAASDEDIQAIAADLFQHHTMGIMAGCAGFAAVIAERIGLKQEPPPLLEISRPLLIVCGSVNEITRKQVEFAEENGMKRVIMTPQQQLSAGYPDSEEGRKWLRQLKQTCESGQTCIIETGISSSQAMDEYRSVHGISLSVARVMIAGALGEMINRLLEMGLEAVIMIIGGDTLAGFVSRLECNEIVVQHELEPGTVLSSFMFREKKHWLISKSGGFGGPELLCSVEALLH